MANINLYGTLFNGDKEFIVNPLQIPGVNSDGTIPEGKLVDESGKVKINIISYINSKTGSVGGKVGIKSVTSSATLSPTNPSTTITVTGNDNVAKSAKLNIDPTNVVKDVNVLPGTSALSFGSTTNIASFNAAKWDGTPKTSKISVTLPDNNAVGAAWKASTTYTNYDKSVNDRIAAEIGKVYKPMGSATVAQIKALVPKDHVCEVYNVTEKFKIDGKVYPEYTNVVILNDDASPSTMPYNNSTGFDSKYVDGLGGMFDQSALEGKINNAVTNISTNTKVTTFVPLSGGDINTTLTFDKGDGTSGEFQVKLNAAPAPKSLQAVTNNDDIITAINAPKFDKTTGSLGVNYKYISKTGSASTAATQIATIAPKDFVSSKTSYGVVKVGSGINCVNGEISVTKNNFATGTGINISQSGTTFTFGLKYSVTGTGAATTGQKIMPYNTTQDAFVLNSDKYISIDDTKANGKTKFSLNFATVRDDIGTYFKLNDITSRVTALEQLLSLG